MGASRAEASAAVFDIPARTRTPTSTPLSLASLPSPLPKYSPKRHRLRKGAWIDGYPFSAKILPIKTTGTTRRGDPQWKAVQTHAPGKCPKALDQHALVIAPCA